MITRLIAPVLLLLVLLAPGAARARESAAVVSARAAASLISDTDTVAPETPFRAALRLRMAPGWHTYWRNPGDAGAPPDIAFTLPDGVSAGPVAWPTPSRQPEGPVMTYGYSGEIALPVAITAKSVPADGITIAAHATWLVCANICVPEAGDFSLHLAAGPPAASDQAPLFAAADARMPRPSPWRSVIGEDGRLAVAGAELSRDTIKDAWFIPDRYGLIDDDAPQEPTLAPQTLTLALRTGAAFKPADGLSGLLVIRDAAGLLSSYSIAAAPGTPPPPPITIPRALPLAFVGGLILNLMPCVFPILAMKIFGLARLAAAGRRHAAAHAASYALGVLASFAALAGLLLVLRAGGSAAGWGFQFQSPAFVAAMTWLMLAVGLNFSGVFSIAGRGAGIGQSLTGRGGPVGSFCAGLLAVLVATPCTAPFMAVAIGAALTASAAGTFSVFLALGAGFATPYVLLACLPGADRLLPRPGRWMEISRQLLAFPMYGAAAWLIWVISQESGPDGVLITAAGAVLVGFGAWAARLAHENPRPYLARAAVGGSLLAGVALLATIGATSAASTGGAAERDNAEPFTAARLAQLRDGGKPVFVNMTAAWCVTCLVNERVALSARSIQTAFAARGVTYLKGDWTRQNPDITAFLRAHGRDGVPLYVFFPGADRGPEIILPQILTQGAVLAALGAPPAG